MYEEGGGLDPNAIMVQGTSPAAGSSEDCFSQMVSDPSPPSAITVIATNSFPEINSGLSLENFAYPAACGEDAATLTGRVAVATAMDIAHQHHLRFKQEKFYNDSNNFNTSFPQEPNHDSSQVFYYDKANLDLQNHYQDQQFLQMELQNGTRSYHAHPTPDLLNLLHLPRCSPSANSSISFMNPVQKDTILQNPSLVGGYQQMGVDNTNSSSAFYDPFLHLNLPGQPPAIRELLQSLPHGYSLPTSRNDLVYGAGGDDREGSGGAYQDGDHGRDFENGVLEFTQELVSVGKKEGKRTKQFTTERQRRVDLGSRFEALKELIPHPKKNDRASVVADAIDYIKELIRTVNELKLIVEKKRCQKESIKRRKVEDDATGDLESCNLKPLGDQDHSYNNGCLRSSWLKRKSKDTEVDVRIVDDQVTIKLVQRKKIDCLLYASKLLNELELEPQHVAGGHIGDFCSFLFNSEICEGSSVYASAIANKLIEVMDRNFAAA
ncbi:hypothetical protein L6164_026948 [Bauhinia variegata]|uniref:Uncharacterized protein n=1 Tax=Bauhinia variegata TaxID=167791 RepID=A0ACB9LRG7_BAUVA|nr:hypothetical protein L6164_026948 [Bauhinia variegata]